LAKAAFATGRRGTVRQTAAVYFNGTELIQQDSQCTYNVTLRRVRVTIVAVEKLQVLRILSVYL
jgi:hypothetical protein